MFTDLAAAAVIVVVAVVAAAAEQQNQDDNPPAVISTKTVIATHKEYLQIVSKRLYRSFHGILPAKKGAKRTG